jgi:surface antigen
LRSFAVIAAIVCAFSAGGCAFQLASMAAKDNADLEHTAALGRQGDPTAAAAGASKMLEADLAYARAVAADVLAHGGKDSSVPWENPHTGAGGNITPLAVAYTEGGLPCRDFLASYVHGESQDWLRGEACRSSQGKWEVKNMKPLKRS